MQDRFRFRAALNSNKYEEYYLEDFSNQKIFDVATINAGCENSSVEIIADCLNGDCAVREIDEADIILMQCTGLKDRNGKLIYEGDIVKNGLHNNLIEWYKDGFWINGFVNGAKWELRNIHQSLEVIGNIYENAELLEG